MFPFHFRRSISLLNESLVKLSIQNLLPTPLPMVPRVNRFIPKIVLPIVNFKDPLAPPQSTIALPTSICSATIRPDLLHWAVCYYRANQRKGLASSKNRGRVSGGGRKIYRQKGTGRARAGSSRAPQRRGGGVCFGPRPRDFSQKLPKKIRSKALASAMLMKHGNNQLRLVSSDSLQQIDSHKTAVMANLLNLHLPEEGRLSRKILIVNDGPFSGKMILASRSLSRIRLFDLQQDGELHCYHALNCRLLIMTPEALQCLFNK